jgi:hypothetical protein
MSETTAVTYAPPVDRLLTLGRFDEGRSWRNYREFGLQQEHVPELIRLMQDPSLLAEDAPEPQVYARIHAWRALGKLGAVEAVQPMLDVAQTLQEREDSDDWSIEELPLALALIGPSAIPQLIACLADFSWDYSVRDIAGHALSLIAQRYPEMKDQCVGALVAEISRFRENPPELNGLLICHLLDLKAARAVDVIRSAYLAGMVDDLLINWGHVRREVRIARRPDDPSDDGAIGRMRHELGLGSFSWFGDERPNRRERDRIRDRRKRERQARKQNRRRR